MHWLAFESFFFLVLNVKQFCSFIYFLNFQFKKTFYTQWQQSIIELIELLQKFHCFHSCWKKLIEFLQ